MFYSENLSKSYRLGDIIKGFTEIIPMFTISDEGNNDFCIRFVQHDFFVILTPCCSIEKKEAIIVPLKKLDENYLVNNYLKADFQILNRPMTHRESLGDAVYEKAPNRPSIEDFTKTYQYIDKFVYNGHPMLPSYNLTRKRKCVEISLETNTYMISFKDAIRINSNIFDRGYYNCCKYLELDPLTRLELREKLKFFYGRPADEDIEFLP